VRILYVINGFDSGGAEHGLLTLVESGCFDGHDVRLLAFCKGRGELADKVLQKLGSDRVQFVTLRKDLTIWGCVAGFCCLFVMATRFRPCKMILSLKQANVVGRLAAIFLPHVTCVAFEHSVQYRARHFSDIYGPLLRFLSWRVDEIWADCSETLTKTREYFLPKQRAERVVPLFLADRIAHCKNNYEMGTSLRLATAGRLIQTKNVAQMVKVVAALREQGTDATLDIFGDGPEFEALSDLIVKARLQSKVVLHGYRSDWIALVTRADIFISLSEREGLCIGVAEAMTAGLPVIAVEVGGIRDYGRDHQNMLKLASPDIETTSEIIRRLGANKQLREMLGRQARTDMLDEYNAGCIKRKMNEALISSNAISSGQAPAGVIISR
jgi:glycosyltransferase involved in cell wall biosynthesis